MESTLTQNNEDAPQSDMVEHVEAPKMALPDIEDESQEVKHTLPSTLTTSKTTSIDIVSLSPEVQDYLTESIMPPTHQKKLILFMLEHKTGKTPASLSAPWTAFLDSLGYTHECLSKEQKKELRDKTQRKMYYLFNKMERVGAARMNEGDEEGRMGKGGKKVLYEFADWCELWREEDWDGDFGRPKGFVGKGFDDEENLQKVEAAAKAKIKSVKEKILAGKVDTVGVAKAKAKVVKQKGPGGKATKSSKPKAGRGITVINPGTVTTIAGTGYATPGDSFSGYPQVVAANERDVHTDNDADVEMDGDEDWEVFDEPIPEGWEIKDGFVVKKIHEDGMGRPLVLTPKDEGYFGPADGIAEEFLRPESEGRYYRNENLEMPEYLDVVAPEKNKEKRVGHCPGCTCSHLS
ncbi:hypothetical protein HYALB_00004131 [Hymenoscyphus albidus]|uniref:Uncharacterized protein n=1 Tax=Hymenoscyphus albidus TaxID=595503 RepID=A0A9N9LFH7_9HELO|nr:hypothetical protein HYALB_00004131 [Hymenoscyphus albidus]